MNNYVDVLTKSEKQCDFNFVELFAGIGGVSFGFEAVGGKCVLAAEYDPTAEGKRQFAQDAYKTLHPGTPVVGDVFKLDADDVPDHDVLSFTTPCQSFSVAGKRLGFEDTRGTLVFEALRIANAKRPKALFMENVKGLVNHDKGRTIDTILHAMNEIGYTVDFNVLNSKYFDVPQNRERVFIIALRDDLVEPSEWYPEGNTMLPKAKRRLKEAGLRTFNFDWPSQNSVDCRLRDVLEAEVDSKYYLAEDKTAKLVVELEGREGLPIREATAQGYAIAHEGDAVNIAFPSSKTRRGRVGEQMDNTLEASGCNQGVVERNPIIIDGSQRLREGKYRVYDDGISPTITAREYKEPRMVGKIEVLGNLKPHRNNSLANSVVSVEGISMTLDTMQGGQREPKIAEEVFNEKERSTAKILRTLWSEIGTEAFAEWGLRVLSSLQQKEVLQSRVHEEGICVKESADKCEVKQGERSTKGGVLHGTNGMSDMQCGREFGCSSCGREPSKQRVEQLIIVMSKLSFKDTQTEEVLQNMWSDTQGVGVLRQALSEIQKVWISTSVIPSYKIRKLTPRETMRLQGFPESATDCLYAEGFSDSRIYKFAGNAVTTTVIKALAERLLPLIDESEAKISE